MGSPDQPVRTPSHSKKDVWWTRAVGLAALGLIVLASALFHLPSTRAQATCSFPPPGDCSPRSGDCACFKSERPPCDGDEVGVGQAIHKQWEIGNCGDTTWNWNDDYEVWRILLPDDDGTLDVPNILPGLSSTVAPGGSAWITLDATAPGTPGHQQRTFRVTHRNVALPGEDHPFGEEFWIDIDVVPGPMPTPTPGPTPTPTPTPPPVPSLDLAVTPGSVGRNTEGWPTPNPVVVTVTAGCPPGPTCGGPLNINIGTALGPRFYLLGTEGTGGCRIQTDDASTPFSASTLDIGDCPVSIPGGSTKTYRARLWMQPSSSAFLYMNSSWEGLTATRTLNVDPGLIHPLVFVHGILGSMPPQDLLITNADDARRLDPFVGSYRPLLENLQKMGYEWNKTLFAVAYDWRNPNQESGDYLRRSLATVIARSTGWGMVDEDGTADLVVHSMGGLVSRAYIQGEAYAGNVRKVVFIASPHKGFPFNYRTWEGGTWADYVYAAPLPSGSGVLFTLLQDRVIWPTLVAKKFGPGPADLAGCNFISVTPGDGLPAPPESGLVFVYQPDPTGFYVCSQAHVHSWSHHPSRGIGSLPQMLPTVDMPVYLVDANRRHYPHGRPANSWLESLNADIGDLEAKLGADDIYVIYGDGAPITDWTYVVGPPSGLLWAQGTVQSIEENPRGDDLIPVPSSTLRLSGLLGSVPEGNEVGVDAAPGCGPVGCTSGRHVPIVYQRATQADLVPSFLTGLTLPFHTAYSPPWVIPDELFELFTVMGGCPIDVMITDPLGRRLGYDPNSGNVWREIPNSVLAEPGVAPPILMIANPVPGTYSLTASGYGDGPYSLRVDRTGELVAPIVVFGEEAAPGDMDEFTVELFENGAPRADAGPDQTVSAGEDCIGRVVLDGTGSADPDDDPLRYTWSGPFGTAGGPTPVVGLALGTHLVTLTVDDGKGQADADTVLITVEDTTPPTILAPEPIVAEQTSRDGTPVTIPPPRVVDNCSEVTVDDDAPEVFPLGTTTVTFTAVDAAGNASTATTTVTVEDKTPPVLVDVPAPVEVEQVGRDGTPVMLPLPSAWDICDAAPVVTSDAPAVFPLGQTTVTFTATDASGNRGTATTTVTVIDTIPPVISSLSISPNTLWPPNHKMATVRAGVSVHDLCDAHPECAIVAVTSNEPASGKGKGDRSPDWILKGDLSAQLRAERFGKASGRRYTLKVRCSDDSGNSTYRTVVVTVPHDRRR
jgi:hypothetical protein